MSSVVQQEKINQNIECRSTSSRQNDENEKKGITTTAKSTRTPSPRREGVGGRVLNGRAKFIWLIYKIPTKLEVPYGG